MEATYDRPAKAMLVVRLENGEEWEATDDDLTRFGLCQRGEAYSLFSRTLHAALQRENLLPTGRLTDAYLNPIRYLVEVAVCYPHLIRHPEHEDWKSVADLERALVDWRRRDRV